MHGFALKTLNVSLKHLKSKSNKQIDCYSPHDKSKKVQGGMNMFSRHPGEVAQY